jgi:alkylation response protein AidB-like acyl-CoA dehydrogenase
MAVDFRLSDDQLAFGQSVRRLIEDAGGTTIGRHYGAGDPAAADHVWADLAQLGASAVLVPESSGGLGLGLESSVPILEELGRALVPGPFAETYVFAAAIAAQADTPIARNLLERIASGSVKVVACFGGLETPRAVPTSNGLQLEVRELLAFHAATADLILVEAIDASTDQVMVVPIQRADPGVKVTSRPALDPTSAIASIEVQTVVQPDDVIIQNASSLARGRCAFQVALACMLVGGMERVLELSVQHAKTRTQFGHPIGRFQAVKHRLVDMYLSVELARSLCYDAALAFELDRPDVAAAAAAAKAYVSTQAIRVALDGIQVHGGVGYTWESDMHLYLKRARAWEHYGGAPADCLDIVAAEQSI